MLVTSNRSVGEWGSVFGDPVVATAILDRLLHHRHVVTIRGDSYRLREKRKSGLMPGSTAALIASTIPNPSLRRNCRLTRRCGGGGVRGLEGAPVVAAAYRVSAKALTHANIACRSHAGLRLTRIPSFSV